MLLLAVLWCVGLAVVVPAERFGRSHIGGIQFMDLGFMSFRVEDLTSSSPRRLCFARPHRPEFSLLSGPTLTLNAATLSAEKIKHTFLNCHSF